MRLMVSYSAEEGWPISCEQKLDLEPGVTRVGADVEQGDQNLSPRGGHHLSQKCNMSHAGSDRLNIFYRSQDYAFRRDWAVGCARLKCCSGYGTVEGKRRRGLRNFEEGRWAWAEEEKVQISRHLRRPR